MFTFFFVLLGLVFAGPSYYTSGVGVRGQSLGSPSGATQADPSSILQSVTSSGSQFVITLGSPATVSGLPSSGARWSVPTRDAFGTVRSVKPTDAILIRLWLGDNGLPADAIVGVALTTGAMSSTALGIGVTLQAGTGGATVAGHSVGSGVSWTNTAASAGSTSTFGAELQISAITTSSASVQMRYVLHPINALGEQVLTANTSPAVAGSNGVIGPWDTLTVWAGWRTGTGGQAGAVVRVSADIVVVPASTVASAARGAVEDANALPISGAVPTKVTILGLGNSHLQGAASGPVDNDFTGDPLPAGVTYRHNNGGVITTPTTWGDREGSVPYLAEKLKALGVQTVNIAVNAGSGRSANGVLTNLGAAAADMYALGEGNNHPDAILYVQSAGNLADQAGYDAFRNTTTGFPAVLDMLNALYPGVPIFVCSGIQADEVEVPFWNEVDAVKQDYCTARGRCTYVNIFLDNSDLDGTDHPTVGHGEGVDIIADAIMAAWGAP